MQRGTQMTKESREKISRAMRERWAGVPTEQRSILLKSWMKKDKDEVRPVDAE